MSRRFASSPLLVLMAAGSAALAYPADYGPFAPGRSPKRFKLYDCTEPEPRIRDADDNPLRITFGAKDNPQQHPRVRMEWDQELWTMSVLDSRGKTIAGPKPVSDLYMLREAGTADLNRDGRPDFVIWIWSGGCGLGAECCTLVFAVSSRETYRITSLSTMAPGPEDFIDVDNDGRCEIIHTAHVWNGEEHERDRKPHTYWVYHLIEIKGGELKPSKKDDRFPRWIWYTFKSNHKPTVRLDERQKRRIWQAQGETFWEPPAQNGNPSTEPASDSTAPGASQTQNPKPRADNPLTPQRQTQSSHPR